MLELLPYSVSPEAKRLHYNEVSVRIKALLADETDWVSGMATLVCELHHAFAYFHWTGFYRAVSHDVLKIGPYQGKHGCLMIPFSKGVCGAAARTKKTQLVPDVHYFEGHIACSSSTMSEIVVPVINPDGELLAVLDIDSDLSAAFDEVDQQGLEGICEDFARQFPSCR